METDVKSRHWVLWMLCLGVVVIALSVIVWKRTNLGCGAPPGGLASKRYSKTLFVLHTAWEAGPSDLHLFTIQDSGMSVSPLHKGKSRYAQISPDGKTVYLWGVGGLSDNYVLDVTERALKPLPNEQDLLFYQVDDWSPDSNEVLFTSNNPPYSEKGIYALNVRTKQSRLIRLVGESEDAYKPRFSPNGKWIAFFIYDRSTRYYAEWGLRSGLSLRVMGANGRGEIQIVPVSLFHSTYDGPALGSPRHLAPPSWSPCGDKLLFHAWFEGEAEGGIYVVNADGSRLRKLVGTGDYGLRSFPDYPMALAWAPDGQRVAYSFDLRVWAQDVDGTDRVDVSARFGEQAQTYYHLVGWTHNGQLIVKRFGESTTYLFALYALDLESGEIEELLSLDAGRYPFDNKVIWLP